MYRIVKIISKVKQNLNNNEYNLYNYDFFLLN